MAIKVKGVFADLNNKDEEIKTAIPYWIRPSTRERIAKIKLTAGAKDYDIVLDKMCELAEAELNIKK